MILESKIYHEELEKIVNSDVILEELNGNRILVTGANGLIGSALVDIIMKWNETNGSTIYITAMCRSQEKAKERFYPYLKKKGFTLKVGDICEPFHIETEWDYIIHAAGNAHPTAFAREPVETMKANLIGTINLLEHVKLQKKKVRKFLFVSTGEVYGEQISEQFREDSLGQVDCTALRSCYPESKRAGETLCISYAAQYGVDVGIARLGYIYGPNFSDTNTRADIQFIKKAVGKQNIIMKSEGLQCRSYCYILDAVRAIFYILLRGKPNNAYNIADDNSIKTIRGFAELLADISGVKLEFQIADEAEKKGYSKMKREVLDTEKIKSLGWQADTNLTSGLKKVLAILQEEKYKTKE